jgi:hypothetical protein
MYMPQLKIIRWQFAERSKIQYLIYKTSWSLLVIIIIIIVFIIIAIQLLYQVLVYDADKLRGPLCHRTWNY